MTIRFKFSRLLAVCAIICAGLSAQTATASDNPLPNVLEVTGVSVSPIAFDIDALRAIGSTEITTSTIWTKGVHRFEGVPLRDFLVYLEAQGRAVEATAINDYAIEIPMRDALSEGPIIAFAMDGAPMPRRAKGPLWIIYPFDSSSKFRTETVYARSIWQLNRLHIVK